MTATSNARLRIQSVSVFSVTDATMLDNKQAQATLERSIVSYAFEILWRSVLLTAALSLVYYFDKPKAFTFSDVWITFVVVTVFHTVLILMGLLLAAGRYRKRPKGWDND